MSAPEPAPPRLPLLLRSALWRVCLVAALGAGLLLMWRWAMSA